MQKIAITLIHFLCATALLAQNNIEVPIPPIAITADRVLSGDADTYGLGTWQCNVQARLSHDTIFLTGQIVFSENANDFTCIVGDFAKEIHLKATIDQRYWDYSLLTTQGRIYGGNRGARGYGWFRNGQGLVQKARLKTDDFGMDAGKIGGWLYLRPIKLQEMDAFAFMMGKF